MVFDMDVNRTWLGWVVAGALLALAVLFVVYSFIGTFVFGLFIYYSTRPVYDRIYRKIGNRVVSATVALLALAVPFLLLLAYTVAVGLQELDKLSQAFNDGNLGGLEEYVGPYLDIASRVRSPEQIVELFRTSEGIDSQLLQTIANDALGYVGVALNGLLHMFIMIVLAYYLLKDGRRLSRWFQSKFNDDVGALDEFARAVDRDFQNIFFGNILNAFLTAIIGALSYTAMDLWLAPGGMFIPYPVLLGLLTGAASLIPVVGMKLVWIPVTGYLGFVSYTTDPRLLWFPVAFAAVSFFVVDVIPDFVLRPYVSGKNLHLGAIMLAYILGPLLFGWYGIFLGPILLVLVIHFARIILPELIADRRLTPYTVDPGYMVVEDTDDTLFGGTGTSAVEGSDSTVSGGTNPAGGGSPPGSPDGGRETGGKNDDSEDQSEDAAGAVESDDTPPGGPGETKD